jgi:hypothetical protein
LDCVGVIRQDGSFAGGEAVMKVEDRSGYAKKIRPRKDSKCASIFEAPIPSKLSTLNYSSIQSTPTCLSPPNPQLYAADEPPEHQRNVSDPHRHFSHTEEQPGDGNPPQPPNLQTRKSHPSLIK